MCDVLPSAERTLSPSFTNKARTGTGGGQRGMVKIVNLQAYGKKQQLTHYSLGNQFVRPKKKGKYEQNESHHWSDLHR